MGNAPKPPRDSASQPRPQRAVPRYTFVANTEIKDPANAMQLFGRVTEISRQGCYVDTMNALPVGTTLYVRISRDQGGFVTRGKIIYVHEHIGMGVAFLNPPKDQLEILDSWLAELQTTTSI